MATLASLKTSDTFNSFLILGDVFGSSDFYLNVDWPKPVVLL